MKTTAEIHNIVYIVNSYVCVGILKSWIRKRVIKDFCLNVQIQRKLHASRQQSIKMFCSSTIICSVCFVRKSLFQIGNKWSAIEFLFLNEATSQTAFLYLGWSPYRYFKEISAVFFISEKKEIQRYITNRKLLVFLFFLIWDCRQNYNAKLGYICNTESPKTWLGKRGVSKKIIGILSFLPLNTYFWLLGINEYWIIKENVGNEYWFWSSYRQGPVFR